MIDENEQEWIVELPIVGRASVIVVASSEEEAKQKALLGEGEDAEAEEWEIVGECRGNICQLRRGITAYRN